MKRGIKADGRINLAKFQSIQEKNQQIINQEMHGYRGFLRQYAKVVHRGLLEHGVFLTVAMG